MSWFKTEKDIKELQAELKALVMKIFIQNGYHSGDMNRYEDLLKEIYLRGAEPEMTLKHKSD